MLFRVGNYNVKKQHILQTLKNNYVPNLPFLNKDANHLSPVIMPHKSKHLINPLMQAATTWKKTGDDSRFKEVRKEIEKMI